MRRRWWPALVVLIVLVAVAAIGILLIIPPTPEVTYANYSRIEIGMTRGQVEALLGEPDRDFHDARRQGLLKWETPAGDIVTIDFDDADRVFLASWNYATDTRTSLEKLRDRVPWLAKVPPRRNLLRL